MFARSIISQVIILVVFIGLLGACRSSQFPKERKAKTIKKGKPIPCPVKDC